jgi:hypothetical protein
MFCYFKSLPWLTIKKVGLKIGKLSGNLSFNQNTGLEETRANIVRDKGLEQRCPTKMFLPPHLPLLWQQNLSSRQN